MHLDATLTWKRGDISDATEFKSKDNMIYDNNYELLYGKLDVFRSCM